MANFESDTTLIPAITVQLTASEGLIVDNPVVERKIPFKGKVALGTVQIGAQSPGEYKLEINKNNIEIRAFETDLQIITQPSVVSFK